MNNWKNNCRGCENIEQNRFPFTYFTKEIIIDMEDCGVLDEVLGRKDKQGCYLNIYYCPVCGVKII